MTSPHGWPRNIIFASFVGCMFLGAYFGNRAAELAKRQRSSWPRWLASVDALLFPFGIFVFASLVAIVGATIAFLVLRIVGAA